MDIIGSLLIKKAETEFQNKAECVTIDSVKKLAIYADFLTYLKQEKLSDEYKDNLLAQDSILDYMWDAYESNRHNYYSQIKESLDTDQLLF